MGILSELTRTLSGTQQRGRATRSPFGGQTTSARSPFGRTTTRGRASQQQSGMSPVLGMLGGLALNALSNRVAGGRGGRRGGGLAGGLLGAALGSALGGRRR